MPDNKKHHYVPKFYLKQFSRDGKSINLFNIKSKKKIIDGNLTNQCYKNYFYGESQKVEKALGIIESEASKIFRVIEKSSLPPPLGHASHHSLLTFVATQLGRTKLATDSLDDLVDKVTKQAYGQIIKEKGIDLSDITIKVNDVAVRSLRLVLDLAPLLLDLDIKVLNNTTGEQFVLSDNPVASYNQFLSFREGVGSTGISCKGLQLFMPVSPSKMLMLYDSSVYTVGNSKSSIVNLSDKRDVYELNSIQMCNAYENIYFLDSDFNCSALLKKCYNYLRRELSFVGRVYHGDVSQESDSTGLIAAKKLGPAIPLKLAFSRIRKGAIPERSKLKSLGALHELLIKRNNCLEDIVEEFNRLVEEGLIKSGKSLSWVQEKYTERNPGFTSLIVPE